MANNAPNMASSNASNNAANNALTAAAASSAGVTEMGGADASTGLTISYKYIQPIYLFFSFS
jgi:hypothetical protein